MNEKELDHRSTQSSAVTEWNDGKVRRVDDFLVGEEPLLIQVGDQSLSVTMRTPGDDFDLAAGFLFTEGIIKSREEIISIRSVDGLDPENSAIQVDLKAGATARSQAPKRNFVANSGCGMCGKTSLTDVYTPGITRPNPDFRIDPQILCGLPDAIRSAQTLFGKTGGLHAAALFDATGKLLALREDVGRHNAVD
jgi:FdhD protein